MMDGHERNTAETAIPRVVPAALAASLSLAAPAGSTRAAADASAPSKKRSRQFNIPRA